MVIDVGFAQTFTVLLVGELLGMISFLVLAAPSVHLLFIVVAATVVEQNAIIGLAFSVLLLSFLLAKLFLKLGVLFLK